MSNAEKVPNRFEPAVGRLDGDFELLCEMAAITSEDIADVKDRAEAAIAQGDCQDAASGLHKLNGMLSTFESDGVALEIQEILDAARKGDSKSVQQAYEQHRGEIEELISGIEALAERSSACSR